MMPRTTATSDAIPHSILSTVLDHCTPAIRGEDDDFSFLPHMYTAPPCVYKRRRRALPWGSVHLVENNTQHCSQSPNALLSPDIGTRLNQLLL